jgi:hypothetical protein
MSPHTGTQMQVKVGPQSNKIVVYKVVGEWRPKNIEITSMKLERSQKEPGTHYSNPKLQQNTYNPLAPSSGGVQREQAVSNQTPKVFNPYQG